MPAEPSFNNALNLEPDVENWMEETGQVEPGKNPDGGVNPGDKILSFFVMPTSALKSLRDEIRIRNDDDIASAILYRYGHTIGKTVTKAVDLKCSTAGELEEKLPKIWQQFGLGHLKIASMDDKELRVEIADSMEGLAVGRSPVPSCYFTAGYMAGMLSTVLDKQIRNTETECICAGAPLCRFQLVISTERIVPRGEAASGEAAKFKLEEGISYMIMEESPGLSFEIFLDMVTHDHEGICISRMFPRRIRSNYKLKETPVLWLCSDEGEKEKNCIGYPHLGRLYELISSFLKDSSRPVVLLDGFEYLITQNEYKSTLKFLQVIIENIAMSGGILILPINPPAMDEKDLNLLIREMTVVRDREQLLVKENDGSDSAPLDPWID